MQIALFFLASLILISKLFSLKAGYQVDIRTWTIFVYVSLSGRLHFESSSQTLVLVATREFQNLRVTQNWMDISSTKVSLQEILHLSCWNARPWGAADCALPPGGVPCPPQDGRVLDAGPVYDSDIKGTICTARVANLHLTDNNSPSTRRTEQDRGVLVRCHLLVFVFSCSKTIFWSA